MMLIILSCFTIGGVVELQVPCKTVYHGLFTWSTTLCGDLKTIGISKPCTDLQSPEKSLLHAVSNQGDSPGTAARFFTTLPVESPQVLHPLPASLALLAGLF
jgi:hypothetical protein